MIFRTPPLILDRVRDLEPIREEILARTGGAPMLLVTGPNVSGCRAFGDVDRVLDTLGTGVVEYIKNSGEPDDNDVLRGAGLYREGGCGGIIAVGGGSQLDTAKAVAILAAHGGEPGDYRGQGLVPGPLPFLIAAAATAGSGSEATPYTVVTLSASGEKVLIASPYLIPDIALADPRFLRSVPADVLAASGVDALCHAVEAFVSRKASALTDRIALEAVAGITAALPRLAADRGDEESARRLSVSATLAGLCIGNASVTLLHGMSRPLGVTFRIPHGLSNALLLPIWAGFTEWFAKEKFARLLDILNRSDGGPASPSLRDALSRLLARLGIPTLRDCLPDETGLAEAAPSMAAAAVASGSPANNPGRITEEEIAALYLKAYRE